MPRRSAAGFAALALAAPALADDWDAATDDDDDVAADNTLRHGSSEEHDLAAVSAVADQDWYRLAPFGLTSWELTIEATGDLDLASNDVQRLDQTGATVLEGAAVSSDAAVLLYENTEADLVQQRLRVQGAACSTTCTAADSYQVQLVDTTYAIPRFNNKGSRVTLVAMSSLRGASTSCTPVNLHFIATDGVGKGRWRRRPWMYRTEGRLVLDTSKVDGVENAKGSILDHAHVRVRSACGSRDPARTRQGLQLRHPDGVTARLLISDPTRLE